MMTLKRLYERLGEILAERPEYADVPVSLQSRKTTARRSASTYEPILYASSVPLRFADGSRVITLIGDVEHRHGAISVIAVRDTSQTDDQGKAHNENKS
jgi:hypothetical protein